MLAQALFCTAIDWIMRLLPYTSGVVVELVGSPKFSDFEYAEDIALLAPRHIDLEQRLMSFVTASQTFGVGVVQNEGL